MFSYLGNNGGTDMIVAQHTDNVEHTFTSNTVEKIWEAPQPPPAPVSPHLTSGQQNSRWWCRLLPGQFMGAAFFRFPGSICHLGFGYRAHHGRPHGRVYDHWFRIHTRRDLYGAEIFRWRWPTLVFGTARRMGRSTTLSSLLTVAFTNLTPTGEIRCCFLILHFTISESRWHSITVQTPFGSSQPTFWISQWDAGVVEHRRYNGSLISSFRRTPLTESPASP